MMKKCFDGGLENMAVYVFKAASFVTDKEALRYSKASDK
jgi:hypothetical protein